MGRLGLEVGSSLDGMKAGGQRGLGFLFLAWSVGVALFDGKAGYDLGKSCGLGGR